LSIVLDEHQYDKALESTMITAAQPQASADKAPLEDRIAEGVARCGAVVTYPWVARSLRHGCLLWKAVVADRGDATDSCIRPTWEY